MASTKYITEEVSQEEYTIVKAQDESMEDENGMQDFILRFNDKDITVNVDSATAYLLTNDHNYAEQYAEAVMNDEVPQEPPEIEYLIEDDAQPPSVNTDETPVVTLTNGRRKKISKNASGVPNTLWSFRDMELLLKVRLNLESLFLHPSSKKFQLWNQVAKKVNSMASIHTTGSICHSKWRNMINTYKRVLKNIKITGKTPNWPLYDVLFQAYGDLTLNEINENLNVQAIKIVKDSREPKLWRTSDIKLLISSRLEMQEPFMQPGNNTSDLWTALSQKIDCVSSLPHAGLACKTKWISLLGTYKKKLDFQETGEDPYVWPYFKMFHDKYKGFTVDKRGEDLQEKMTGKWTSTNSKLLILTRIEMDVEFKSQKKPRSRLWSITASKINAVCQLGFTGPECDSKWRSLVKTYRKITSRMAETGEIVTMWPHYNLINQLFRSRATDQPNSAKLLEEVKDSDGEDDLDQEDSQSTELWPSSDTELLISSRLEMQATFSITGGDRDELWTSISQKINCVSSLPYPGIACKKKWLQLLRTYKSKLDYNETGEDPYTWPYFKMFHEAYEGFIINHNGDTVQEEKTAVWTHGLTKLLVITRIDMDKSFQFQNIKKTLLWSKVAARMNSVYPLKLSAADCDCKWRNLMGTYRKICSRIIETGQNTSSWPYYDLIDKLYGKKDIGLTSDIEAFLEVNINDEGDTVESAHRFWTHEDITLLIKLRVEMEEKFQNPNCKRCVLWNDISKKVNKSIQSGIVTGTECNVKWRNLKRTYRVLMSKMKGVHVSKPSWPYFKVFHDLYGDLSNKSPVEVEVSFNEDHGYVFEVLPTNVTDESQPEIVQSLNTGTLQQEPVPITLLSSESQLPKTNRGLKRLLDEPGDEVSGSSKMWTSIREERWLKLMLLDWKKERRERWEEKKKIEREKIIAVNNLTKAILSLERR